VVEAGAAIVTGGAGGKPGTADNVAAAVEFLLSDAAGFISGIALPVDGAFR
jgi:NAD(P)-dependent dehydrogenase (short-subunit alcohol dehydrogenase family)